MRRRPLQSPSPSAAPTTAALMRRSPLQSPSPSAAPTTAAPMRPLRTPRWGNIFAVPPEPDEVFNFKPGDLVEVLPNEAGLRGAHFAAVVVGPSKKPRRYIVQYDAVFKPEGSDNPPREAVPARILRPRPPPPHRAPAAREAPAEHAAVDALLGEAWWLGVALGGAGVAGKVRVCFPDTREVMEFDASDVRPHLEWVAGSWRSPSVTAIPKTMPYTKGMKVEVSKLEHSSVVAWLPAVVAKTFWKNNLLVEYTGLKSDGIAFSEIVDVKHVRPCRPQGPPIGFRINDNVEAFQGAGWWLGVITNIHPGLKYTCKSAHSGVEVQLSQELLRLRYDLVDGVWKQKSQSTTPESGPPPRSAASIKKRKTQVDGLPDPAASQTKKHKSPKLGPSEENSRHKSSSKEIYPDPEKRLHRDARPDDQAKPAPQPEPTPAPAERRKVILKLSLPMNQPAAAPDATVLPPTRESDAEKNEAVQNTVTTPIPEVETCSKSPAKSPLTPLDVIIEEMKGCREQWLKAQSQLDHSVTKAKELEGQVAKLRAASETDAQHLREMMDNQASLEQRLELKDKEIEDLKKKLVDLGDHMSHVEAELPRGAVMAASHALGVLKNHLPNLDVRILSKGYACTPAEAQALADQARPIVKPFVKRLKLSVSSASEDEV